MSIALDARQVPEDPQGTELRCPACDYDLRALVGERCPECGLVIDRAALAQSQIPWAHRDRLGSFRAYQRTAWLAWRHPKRLAMSAASPVDLQDARNFQRINVLFVFLPGVVIGIAYIAYYGRDYPDFGFPPAPGRFGYFLEWLLIAIFAGCVWLFLLAVTSVAQYFFLSSGISATRRERAVALSYYASAPLAVSAIPIALIIAASMISNHRWDMYVQVLAIDRLTELLVIATILILGLQIGGWFSSTIVLLKKTTACGAGRILAALFGLPTAWLIVAFLFLVLLPFAALYLALMILSLK